MAALSVAGSLTQDSLFYFAITAMNPPGQDLQSQMLILMVSAPCIVLSLASQSSCLCMSIMSPQGICKGKQASPSRKVTNIINSAAFYRNYSELIPTELQPVAQNVLDIAEFSLGFTAAQSRSNL